MKKNFLIPVLFVTVVILQGFCMPSTHIRLSGDDFDVDDYDPAFIGWSADSLAHLCDSLISLSEIDSVQEDDKADSMLFDAPENIIPKLDSCARLYFVMDSTQKAKLAFQEWFNSLTKKEQKRWTMENVTIPEQRRKADSIIAVKDSIKAYKDSVIQATPRILETEFLPDSLHYRRLLLMTQDPRFGDITVQKFDTSYNYHFNDYPFMKKDVNANWLGVAGSATQYYDFSKREDEENAIFFSVYRPWAHTPSDIPMYNTKTPHTELAYWGTLLSGTEKEEIDVRFLTTQNITPALNVTLEVNKYTGKGLMQNEETQTYDLGLTTNYLGKRYCLHAGWLHSKITRLENGGFQDNSWIRDTTVASREIEVNLSDAENDVTKNTVFLTHSYRIPFGSDSLTTAYIGHSLDWSNYSKYYSDNISSDAGRSFYNNQFYINSSSSADTMKVMKLDNKLFIRLRPWTDDAFVSRLDVGVGDKLLSYYDFYRDSTGVNSNGKTLQNNLYAYAGVRGMIHQYFQWNAAGQMYFVGPQAGDFSIDGNIRFNFYPFRKARKSPLSIGAFFHTDLTEPDHYQQRLFLNHYHWENDFSKQSTTKFGGTLDIPHWNLGLDLTYTLKANAIYYDTLGVIRQNAPAVSIISAALRKNFVLWKFHFDNRILFQMSSNQLVAPVPMLALNLRYYFEFTVVKNAMTMQIGANGMFNTSWNMPRYNPNVGVFYNQNKESYGMCPYIDAFVNIQWKRASIFLKVENLNQGWPKDYGMDYFCSDGYIHTQRTFKCGIHWPFYIKPGHSHSHGSGSGIGAGASDADGGGHDHGTSSSSSSSSTGKIRGRDQAISNR